ncbi:hypothetical protein BYT27DRAFT_7248182 [Phlegmacium glaucopus]|nr:hypothetical protein BYT27DRAFT_7248182 [Phlegmacium glaucopus]
MSAEVITPFHGDKEDENPEDFLRAFFRRMGNSNDEVKKTQFPNYLQADGVADDWYIDLDNNEKKTWAEIEAAFRKRWPRKKQVKKTVKEYEEEILNQTITTEDLAKKEKVAGREIYSHIAWADKMAKAVKGAKLDKTTTYIRQVRKELLSILQEKVGTGHEDWDTFLQAVRDVDIDYIRDSMDIWNKSQAEQKAIERRIQFLETVSKSPTAPIRQQLATVAISKRQPLPNTADMNNPFESNSGGQGNLRFPINPNAQRQNRANTTNFNPRPPPTAEQKAELRTLLSTMPHHLDTQAGRQAHQAQQAEWMRNYGPGTKVMEKTPYPLRPGTAPVNSGECFTCGQVGHLGLRSGENCQALGYRTLHPNEQQWRAICTRILKEPRGTTNIHFLAVDNYGTNWQDIQGNEEGPSK